MKRLKKIVGMILALSICLSGVIVIDNTASAIDIQVLAKATSAKAKKTISNAIFFIKK